MRILLIGGTRFIGRRTAQHLAEAGHEVAVFHRGQTNHPLPDSIQHVIGDIANLDDFRDTFANFAPDAVIHTNLMEQGDATQMMRVFRGIAGRVVVVSSADVYLAWGRLLNTEPGPPEPTPLTEISPLREERYPYRNTLNQDWRYFYDKIHVEQVAMQLRRPPAVIVRLPMVYGE
jgi:nucleoside-diphosphate-sugar epimerase